jgi:hypothetical protein
MTDQESIKRGESSAKAAAEQAKAAQKLLSFLALNIFKVYTDKDLPFEQKILLIPLLVMVPVCSLVLVIFIGELTYCLLRSHTPAFLHYLIFLATIAPTTFLLLIFYTPLAQKFEAARNLESQLGRVTEARAPRNRRRSRA